MGDRDTLRARFTRLTIINILSNVTVPLVGLVDTAMLGHLADIRFLAGVALGTILFDYVYWSFGFLRMGTTERRHKPWGGAIAARSTWCSTARCRWRS